MLRRMLFPIVILALASGCVPYRITERPLISGTAIAETGLVPLTGASVRLSLLREGRVFEAHDLTTDKSGRFRLRRQSTWGSSWAEQEYAQLSVRVELRAAGYAPERRELRWMSTGSSRLEFGALRMRLEGGASTPAQ